MQSAFDKEMSEIQTNHKHENEVLTENHKKELVCHTYF